MQIRVPTPYGAIAAVEAGPSDGDIVVALHSLGMSSDLWISVGRLLGAAGQRFIAVDARGHGRTTYAPLAGSRDWVDDLRTVIDEVTRGSDSRQSVHLLGASMGSLQALEFALSEPERVSTLMLASGFGHMDRDLAAAKTAKLTDGPTSVGMPEWGARYARETLLTSDPSVHQLVRSTVGSTSLEAYVDAVRVCYEERSGPISSIDVPSLVLWGEEDTKTPAELSEALTADLSVARMVRIPGGGHLCMLDEPKRFTDELLRFIEGPTGTDVNLRPDAYRG